MDDNLNGLAQFASDLEAMLGESAEVLRHEDELTRVHVQVLPRHREALPVRWLEMGDEVILETGSGPGGRWELGTTDEEIRFLARVPSQGGRRWPRAGGLRGRSVPRHSRAGRWNGSDRDGYTGCLPKPFWPKRGLVKQYAPYRP